MQILRKKGDFLKYGTPYKGSKNRIAKDIIDKLPSAEYFVDLFAGGCAVTHCAMLSGKYEKFIINDIDSKPIKLFINAIKGQYKEEKRWISRENFYKLKNTDPYVAFCWSFGNNGQDYLYSKEIEPWKKALHYARVLNDNYLLKQFGIDSDGSKQDIVDNQKEYKQKYTKWWLGNQGYSNVNINTLINCENKNIEYEKEKLRTYLICALEKSGLTQSEVERKLGTQMAGHYFGKSQWSFPTQEMYNKMQEFMPLEANYNELESLQRLRSLQSLEKLGSLRSLQSLQSLESTARLRSLRSLQSLQSLESTARLQSYSTDYQNVKIPENSVLYCDIPYRGTNKYTTDFDYERFYNWARLQKNIYISEYNMPDEFEVVYEKDVCKLLHTQGGSGKVTEKLFTYNAKNQVVYSD